IGKEVGIANGNHGAVHFGDDAFARHGVELLHGFDGVAVLGGVGGHGFADVMLGAVFGGGHQPDELGFAPAGSEVDHIGDGGLAQGEGAGFVEGDGVYLAEVFQIAASFEENAVAGGVG